ncbi:MAG: hypothetical protein ACRDNK_14755 [Solirubrobacteraceae bacterium]
MSVINRTAGLDSYMQKHRDAYYGLLQETRNTSDWRAWLAFFLEGVAEVASEAAGTAGEINTLRESLREQLHAATGRRAGNALRLLEHLFRNPGVSVETVRRRMLRGEPHRRRRSTSPTT